MSNMTDARLSAQVVGYVNRRTDEVICRRHGTQEVTSPRTPWVALRVVEGPLSRYESTAPVICHRCGAWLNDESTGYAIASLPDGVWKRRLRLIRSHRHC
ncbi:MAG: hypothetical protein ACRDLN_01705 [Solirubrobacteraceae bacterium]